MLTPKEKLEGLNSALLKLLTTMEPLLTREYRITSGKRDPEKNAAVGGVKDSAHEQGLALDVAHDGDIVKAMRLAYALGRLGIVRVGFYTRHVHFDIDTTKPATQWEGISK